MTSAGSAEIQIDLDFTTLSKGDTPVDEKDEAVARLALASREYIDVRQRLAEYLPALVENLSISCAPEPTLRCIGNACADNEAGRDAITAIGFSWTAQFLLPRRDEPRNELRKLAIQVLYNICEDHEASQKQCYRDKVHHHILGSWFGMYDHEDELVRDVLFCIIGHKAELEPTLQERLPAKVLSGLFDQLQTLENGENENDVVMGTELILFYLRDPVVQGQISSQRLLHLVIEMVKAAENPWNLLSVAKYENKDILKKQAADLVWCLSDISANPEFVRSYSLEDHIISGRYVSNTPEDEIDWDEETSVLSHICDAKGDECSDSHYVACCQIIGNFLWALPPESYASWAEQGGLRGFALHESLLDVLASANEGSPSAEALHSIAGVLIQLSRPSVRARKVIGQSESALAAVEHLSRHNRPEIRHDCLKLLKALGKDCRENQAKFDGLAREVLLSLQQQPTMR